MIKKIVKFLFVLCVVCAVLVTAAFFTLKKMYPPAKLKVMVQNYVSQNLHRELTFDSISFTWIGFTLTNVALSEESTFQEGTFIQAKTLTAHVAVKPLLRKRVEITTIQADQLQVNLVAKQDGTFNFSSLFSNEPATTASTAKEAPSNSSSSKEENPLVITAQAIDLTTCDLVYRDDSTGLRTALEHLNIHMADVRANQPFETRIDFTTDVSGINQPTVSVPVSLQFTTFLANMDLAQAYATISQATARYKTIQFDLQGDVRNFQDPQVDLTGVLTGITNTVLADVAPGLPNFTLPAINMTLQAKADMQTKRADIRQAKLSVQDSSLTAQGTFAWNTPTPTYQLGGSLTAVIDQLMQMTDTLDNFKPTGTIIAKLQATDKKNHTDVRGSVTLNNASFLYTPFTLTELNGTVLLGSLSDISSPKLTGRLNGEAFTGSFSYKELANAVNLVLNINLDKLILTQFAADTSAETEADTSQTATATNNNTTENSSLPMNLQANVTLGGIEIPYFQAQGLTLSANLMQLTDTMQQANGTLHFNFQPGKITNLDHFIKENKIAKVLLLPVSIIKTVSGMLKVDLFPATGNPQGTTISFTEGAGDYTFTDGVMNIDRTVFNSSVTQISATGTANFKTDALDMKATATLLTEVAPVAFKITGTLSNPKGKLDVVNTVTSVVGGLLNGMAAKSAANGAESLTKDTANLATDVVKDTVNTATQAVKDIGSLFKKKNTQEPATSSKSKE